MPMDGVMLSFISRELSQTLRDGRIDRIIQPERDELHLLIRAQGANVRLLLSASANAARVHLTNQAKNGPAEPPMFCMLLRKHLAGARIEAVRQIAGDRILSIDMLVLNELGDLVRRHLITEMMGRHSNIILTDQDFRIIDAIRRVGSDVSRLRVVQPGAQYCIPATQDKLDPAAATIEDLAARFEGEHGSVQKAILHSLAGFSPQASFEAVARLGLDPDDSIADQQPIPVFADRLLQYVRRMPELTPSGIVLDTDGSPMDVFPFPQQHLFAFKTWTYNSASEALEAFYGERDRREHMKQRASGLSHLISNSIERCTRKILLQDEALAGAKRMDEYRKNGELLQANLYRLEKGTAYAEVEDYYTENCPVIQIPMDTALSPAQNAQRYFKLYRKARGAKLLAAEQKEKAESDLLFLEQMQDDLRKASSEKDLSELRSLLEEAGFAKRHSGPVKKKKDLPSLPMQYRSSDGTLIEVGKNAVQNERLTLSAKGEELWLHAQKMPGSHVIVHSPEPSDQTIQEAVLLAAYYSKGSRSAQVPVDATKRRYIKKPGGTPVGYVTYTHQQTFYVTPHETAVSKLQCIRA